MREYQGRRKTKEKDDHLVRFRANAAPAVGVSSSSSSMDSDNSLDWAKQAYEKLKKQQEDKKKVESLNNDLIPSLLKVQIVSPL